MYGLPQQAACNEARRTGLKRYFTGKPCLNGHIAERMTSTRACVECKRDYEFDSYTKDPVKFRQRALKSSRQKANIPEATRVAPDKCEMCGAVSPYSLCIDHDHKTGAFRGWLCFPCNTGLGKLGDNIDGLLRAIEYLKRAEVLA